MILATLLANVMTHPYCPSISTTNNAPWTSPDQCGVYLPLYKKPPDLKC